ncbi:hypothetical protein A9K55_003679, partial [Cordyceps militaris]
RGGCPLDKLAASIIIETSTGSQDNIDNMPWHYPQIPKDFKTSTQKFKYWRDHKYGLRFTKFDIGEDEVWGSLHERFNTAPMTIMDREAWHTDVVEILRKSYTVDELYAELEKRKKQRLDELTTAMTSRKHPTGWYSMPSEPLKQLARAVTVFQDTATMYSAVLVVDAMTKVEQVEHEVQDRESKKRIALSIKARGERRIQRRIQRQRREALQNQSPADATTPVKPGRMLTPPDDESPGREHDAAGDDTKKRKREDADTDSERESGSSKSRPDTATPPTETRSRAASPAAVASPTSYCGSSDFSDREEEWEYKAQLLGEMSAKYANQESRRCGCCPDPTLNPIGDPDEQRVPTRICFEACGFRQIDILPDDSLIEAHDRSTLPHQQ